MFSNIELAFLLWLLFWDELIEKYNLPLIQWIKVRNGNLRRSAEIPTNPNYFFPEHKEFLFLIFIDPRCCIKIVTVCLIVKWYCSWKWPVSEGNFVNSFWCCMFLDEVKVYLEYIVDTGVLQGMAGWGPMVVLQVENNQRLLAQFLLINTKSTCITPRYCYYDTENQQTQNTP